MAVPRAQLGGAFGSGQTIQGSRAPDYGQIIDAVVGGAGSLIQAAYMRKVAQRNAAVQQEQQRLAAEDRLYQRQQVAAKTTFDQDLATRKFTADQDMARQRLALDQQRATSDATAKQAELRGKGFALKDDVAVPLGGAVADGGMPVTVQAIDPKRYEPAGGGLVRDILHNPQQERVALIDRQTAAREKEGARDRASRELVAAKGRETTLQVARERRPGGAAGGGRPPTEGERSAAALLPEIRDAETTLMKYDDPTVTQRLAGKYGTVGNFLNSNEGRQFKQSSTQYLSNITYGKSGKAITDNEWQRLADTYIPLPGDDAGTLALKRRARQLARSGVEVSAGRARASADSAYRVNTPDAEAAAAERYKTDAPYAAYVDQQRAAAKRPPQIRRGQP